MGVILLGHTCELRGETGSLNTRIATYAYKGSSGPDYRL